jgi:cation diffusion facilitator family transporter
MTHLNREKRGHQIRRITIRALAVNCFLMAIKIVVGLLVRSTALVADGVHSVSDLATDLAVLAGARFANRPADASHPYGHGKFESLTSIFIAILLLLASSGLIWSAGLAIYRHERSFPGFWVLVVAAVSVIFKESMFHFTLRVSRAVHSSVLHANAWHQRSDALSSVAVLAGGAAALLGWGYADHAATILVGLMIVGVAVKILYDSLVDLTDHAADRETVEKIKGVLDGERNYCSWHALRTRRIGGELFLDLHILCDPDMSVRESHSIANRIEQKIKGAMPNPVNILIHIEPDIDDRHS